MTASPPEAASTGHRRVLVIDDDATVVRAIARVLRPEHDVSLTVDAEEAVAWIREGQRFDLIVCDLNMPRMSGMDFFTEVERIDPGQRARVLFLTGGAYDPEARAFLARIPNPRFDKPIDAFQLRQAAAAA